MAFTYSKALSLSSGNNVFVSCVSKGKVCYTAKVVFIKTGMVWKEKKLFELLAVVVTSRIDAPNDES